MNAPKVIKLPANWHISRAGQKIQIIVAHDTERPTDASNSIAYLQRGGALPDGSDRGVSIHALIELDGTIYEMVADELGANHAGYSKITLGNVTYAKDAKYNVNHISLGFELEYTKAPSNDPYPQQQLLSMGWWINQKRALHGQIPIVLHATIDTQGKTDTRNLSVETIEYWCIQAALITPNVKPTPEQPQMYKVRVSQVIYTDRSLSSPLAGSDLEPLMLIAGQNILIGDITGDWAWLRDGRGFVPVNILRKVS